ncbi:MAG: FAD-dependent oxidoreductase, partial [Candidatus Woesearchaeota archaeon]
MAKDKEFIILGAGITGLSTAVELDKKGEKSIIIEKDKEVGGLCKSFHQNGCTLDLGPHKLYSQLPGIMEYFKDVLKDDCLTVKKTNSIFLLDKKINFPINISNLISCVSPKTVITGTKAGFSFAGQTAKAVLAKNKIHTYEDWFINGFGKAGYNLVFRDYAWKVWGDPKTLSWELGKKRVPISGLFGFVKNMLSKKEKAKISAEFFYYPKQGMGEFCEKLYKD